MKLQDQIRQMLFRTGCRSRARGKSRPFKRSIDHSSALSPSRNLWIPRSLSKPHRISWTFGSIPRKSGSIKHIGAKRGGAWKL